jgi:orotidine-5'-phosphate decarboxylase
MVTEAGKRIIVALDFAELPLALEIADCVGPQVGMLKVGLELFNSVGTRAIEALRERGARVFYDSKFYDIPNTVAGAAAAATRLGVSMFNVHALGGLAMMSAARDAAERSSADMGLPAPAVVAVTVVTSLSETQLQAELGIPSTSTEAAVRLARLARDAGLDGVVCSAHEIDAIKRACGREFLAVTPGIRPQWAQAGDQARVATPREALTAGADYLVIGRPITRAPDPAEALERVITEMSAGAS